MPKAAVGSMGETKTPALPEMEAAASASAASAPAPAPRDDRRPIVDRTPLVTSEPAATSSARVDFVGMKAELEPKVFGGTATKKEAAKLRAVCAHLRDSVCRDKAAKVYVSLPDD